MQAIPSDYYDAALVDGAGPLQTWWYITLPGLRPTFIFLILTGTYQLVRPWIVKARVRREGSA